MKNGNVALLLVYEPPTTKRGPVPLARVCDPALAVEVAKAALVEAQTRADELARADELLGEVEQVEVERLQRVLSILVPGLASPKMPIFEVVQ